MPWRGRFIDPWQAPSKPIPPLRRLSSFLDESDFEFSKPCRDRLKKTWIQTSVGDLIFLFFLACGSYGYTTCYYSECEDCNNTPDSA